MRMIVVDTNVLSQLTRATGDVRMVAWINRHFDVLYVPALVVSELIYGTHILPDRVQRDALLVRTELLLARLRGRFLAFDYDAAVLHGRIAGKCRQAGRAMTPVDGRIAAIALMLDAPVATRDPSDFEPTGVRLVDPRVE